MSKITKVITIIVLVIVFSFFTYFLSGDIFLGDDSDLINSIISGGGKYNLDSFFTSLLSHFVNIDIPFILNINPHEFSMTITSWIRSFNVVLLCFIMSSFMFMCRKKTKIFPLIIIFSAFYFCYACSNMDFDWINPNQLPVYDLSGSFILLTECSQNFGQILPLILGLFFIYLCIYYFSQNFLPDKKFLILFSIISFITASSSMFVSIICGILLFMICFYLFVIKILDSKKINFPKLILYPCLSYLAGTIIFSIYPGFFNYFSNNVKLMPFIKTVIKIFVKSNSLEISLIAILSAILYFLALKKSTYIKRIIFSVYSILLGAFLYFLMYSSLNINIESVLTESVVLLRIILISMIFLLLGSCFKEHTSEPKELKVLSFTFSFIVIAFAVVQIPIVFSTIKIWHNMCEETKVTVYCIEKMYRFYSLKGQTALLPEDAILKIFKISYFLNDEKVKETDKITRNTFFKNTSFIKYYKKFYKNPNIVAYKFIDAKKALKIFYEEGGIINAAEIKKVNFQNLYNDKFILNRAIEKSRYDR